MKNAMQLKAVVKNIAKEKKISAQLVLQNYMLERFLERVSVSEYRNNFIIKGGFLIASMVGLNSRATMDMDATIKRYPVSEEAIQKMVEEIIRINGNFFLCRYKITQKRGGLKLPFPALFSSFEKKKCSPIYKV